jgi:DNA-binding response OmpR family regulator
MAMHEILLIEDHIDTGDIMKTFLEFEGFAVRWSKTFESAFTELNDGLKPCVVLMDLNVPGVMTAHDFIRNVRGLCPDVHIVVLSGQSPGEDNFGADGFLPKPYDHKQLVKLVAEKCGR